MKVKLIVLCVINFQFTPRVLSQPYSCFNPSRTLSFYSSNDGYSFIKADSVSGSVLFFNSITEEIMEFESHSYCARPSLYGQKMMVGSNGENIFINKHGDSIFIPTQAMPDDTNFLVTIDSLSFYFTIMEGFGSDTIFGIIDSVKVFRLYASDHNGDTVNANYNGQKILLSKNFGIIQGYDFYKFPGQDTMWVSPAGYPYSIFLSGQTNPDYGVTNLTALEIYDFEIGDEFHYKRGRWQAAEAPYSYQRIIITDKMIFGADSIKYTAWTQTIGFPGYGSSTPPPYDDTLITEFAVSDASGHQFSILPPAKNFNAIVRMFDRNGKHVFYATAGYDGCLSIHKEHCEVRSVTYARGLGMTDLTTLQSGSCLYHYYEKLYYFNKADTMHGTPLDFASLSHRVASILAPIGQLFAPEELELISSDSDPDQFEVRFHFTNEMMVSLNLYNSIGQKIDFHRKSLVKESIFIPRPDMLGIYFLEVIAGSKRKIFKLF